MAATLPYPLHCLACIDGQVLRAKRQVPVRSHQYGGRRRHARVAAARIRAAADAPTLRRHAVPTVRLGRTGGLALGIRLVTGDETRLAAGGLGVALLGLTPARLV